MTPLRSFPVQAILRSSFFFFLLTSSVLAAPAIPASDSCIVYPSPAKGDSIQVVYNMPLAGEALVLFYNESGDLVAERRDIWPAGLQTSLLNLFYFRKGLYLCRVTLDLGPGGKRTLKPFKFTVIR